MTIVALFSMFFGTLFILFAMFLAAMSIDFWKNALNHFELYISAIMIVWIALGFLIGGGVLLGIGYVELVAR